MIGRGVTQVNYTSPMIFIILVDAVVRAVLDLVCSPQETQHGMRWVDKERNILFYADEVRIAGRYHEWVQDALMVTVAMFRRMGIDANIENTKVMVCRPGFI